eukprot:TRINITY_DN5666_c0_g2_i1.p1 TRINITY_DN5666_c0_g2~~TRINITY_DN5666_c0_g2_i1.p1  ORF type:complete len:163 (+),score=19.25 TRINITY_DN5666_c0_g2_i1:54-491(+)
MEVDGMCPLEVTYDYWVFECMEEQSRASGMTEDSGKWMLFYPNEQINEAWQRACHLYRGGYLPGVHSMKVSTGKPNPRCSSSATKVIIFYCGPSADKTKMLSIGRTIASAMGVSGTTISYKPDYMTLTGTAATGQLVNHLYRLTV